jgi:Na+-driven multidrug efflux pump
MLFGTVIIELFPHTLASLFTDEKDLINTATRGLRYVFIFAPLGGFQIVSIGFFQSIGKAYKSITLSASRQIIILIPLLIILPKFFGATGVWISIPISDFLSSLLVIYMIFVQYRSFTKTSKTN